MLPGGLTRRSRPLVKFAHRSSVSRMSRRSANRCAARVSPRCPACIACSPPERGRERTRREPARSQSRTTARWSKCAATAWCPRLHPKRATRPGDKPTRHRDLQAARESVGTARRPLRATQSGAVRASGPVAHSPPACTPKRSPARTPGNTCPPTRLRSIRSNASGVAPKTAPCRPAVLGPSAIRRSAPVEASIRYGATHPGQRPPAAGKVVPERLCTCASLDDQILPQQ